MKDIPVTVIVATCGRYTTTLPLCLLSIVNQTITPHTLILIDDNKEKKFYEHEILKNILVLLKIKGIKFEYYHGESKGQVYAQQKGLENLKTEWFLKIDDDCILESNIIELFYINIKENIGAISGLILSKEDIQKNRKIEYISDIYNKIEDIYRYFNIQMCLNQDDEIKKVEHIYSCYFLRKSLIDIFPLEYSPVGHREDTVTTYQIFKKGYDLIIDPKIKIYHFHEMNGGNRIYEDNNKNDILFLKQLKNWGININLVEDEHGVYENRNGNLWKIYEKI